MGQYKLGRFRRNGLVDNVRRRKSEGELSDFIYQITNLEDFMKIIKRIIAVTLIIVAVLLVSYLIYTGGQVNA